MKIIIAATNNKPPQVRHMTLQCGFMFTRRRHQSRSSFSIAGGWVLSGVIIYIYIYQGEVATLAIAIMLLMGRKTKIQTTAVVEMAVALYIYIY